MVEAAAMAEMDLVEEVAAPKAVVTKRVAAKVAVVMILGEGVWAAMVVRAKMMVILGTVRLVAVGMRVAARRAMKVRAGARMGVEAKVAKGRVEQWLVETAVEQEEAPRAVWEVAPWRSGLQGGLQLRKAVVGRTEEEMEPVEAEMEMEGRGEAAAATEGCVVASAAWCRTTASQEA